MRKDVMPEYTHLCTIEVVRMMMEMGESLPVVSVEEASAALRDLGCEFFGVPGVQDRRVANFQDGAFLTQWMGEVFGAFWYLRLTATGEVTATLTTTWSGPPKEEQALLSALQKRGFTDRVVGKIETVPMLPPMVLNAVSYDEADHCLIVRRGTQEERKRFHEQLRTALEGGDGQD